MNISKNNVKYQLAERLFDLFVMNDKYMAIQMPDGRYIPKRMPCTPTLIYDMLESNGSFGVYQQQFCGNQLKWVCLDFDCKFSENLEILIEKYVQPAARALQSLGIHFLAEFSGRRGVHLWILSKGILTKPQGFRIVDRLSSPYRQELLQDKEFGLDLFPAVAGGGNKFGKQVKLPLSVHKKGGRSFFIPDILKMSSKDWLHLPERNDFWEIQLEILQTYIPNETETLWRQFEITPQTEQREKGLLYKKEYLIADKKVSLEEIQHACSDSRVIYTILQRAVEGNLHYLDRLVLMGCFGNLPDNSLLLDIMKQQKNYKENVTRQYLSTLKNRYYPITLQYLYDLYGEEPEQNIDLQSTILEYMAERLGMQVSVLNDSQIRQNVPSKRLRPAIDLNYFRMIRDKEFQYMRYDDEVLSVSDYLEISGLKLYDFQTIMEKFNNIVAGREFPKEQIHYSLYKRWEEGKDTPRILVTLAPQDRILTTALIFELANSMNWRFRSYSYNLNFWDYGSVFMPWYDSWKRFQQDVECFLYLDFFREYGMIKLDLTHFYDSIYMHALFHQIEETNQKTPSHDVQEKTKYILRYLGSYTETLMLQINGNIQGVPQGPAYARVLAELFLTAVLDSFCGKFGYSQENCHILRYVDDLFIIYRNVDGQQLLSQFSSYIQDRGLNINWNKTQLFERIGSMSEWQKQSIFEDGAANYAMKTIQGMELEDEDERQEKIQEFEKYLKRKGSWNIRDANFILNRYLDPVFVQEYLNHYAETLIQQTIGRGSIYKRLYEEIFRRDEWLERFFASDLYRNIPPESVNFKNFISVCYFQIFRIRTVNQQYTERFLIWLGDEDHMDTDDRGTARAIIRLLGEDR